MIFLFVHQNFPGQYKQIVRYLADQPGNTVYFITQNTTNAMVGVKKLVYKVDIPKSLNCHPYSVDYDIAVRTGLAVAQVCQTLEQQGIIPDFIAGHCGWGETLFIKDVFPDAPLLSYFEFFYHFSSVDVDFDEEYPADARAAFRLRTRNAVNLLSFDAADWGNTPTKWQRSLHPPELRTRLTRIHEGIDTALVVPDPSAWVKVGGADSELTLTAKDEVITYVARNLEPYRGFHIFMRAAVEILRRRPKAYVIMIGGDDVSYGPAHPSGRSFREVMMAEVGHALPMDRVFFPGQVSYDVYINVLQVSSAHVYLTYPFVLSWSFIEAMSAGCAIIGSDTPPVMEVLQDGENGLAVDFFSPIEIADRVDQILDHPTRMQHMRDAARQTAVKEYDFTTVLLPRWLSLMDDMMNGKRPKTEFTSPPIPATSERAGKKRAAGSVAG
jgi:glycosyltransferase involved in cell wall biosynthesis